MRLSTPFPRGRAAPRAASLCAAALVLLAGCTDVTGSLDTPREARALAEQIFGRGGLQWFTPDSVGAWTMHPLLDENRVYFERSLPLSGSGDVVGTARLMALDRATGAVIWHGPIVTAENAALAGGSVGAVWGSLAMFDRATGGNRRVFRFEPTSLSGNVVSDGARFYVGSHDGKVLAVDPHRVVAEWERDLAGSPSTTTFGLALEGDLLAATLKHFADRGAAPDSGIVAILDRATGAQRWRVALGAPDSDAAIADPPVITAGLVIVVTQGHEVHAFDAASGAARWSRSVSFNPNRYGSSGLSACGDVVVVATGELGVIALDAATGAIRWRRGDLRSGSLFGLECSHGTVIARGSNLQVLDARTGRVRARYPLRTPVVAGRDFYIASATRDAESLYIGTTYGYAKVAAP